jgi:hypothetical protein
MSAPETPVAAAQAIEKQVGGCFPEAGYPPGPLIRTDIITLDIAGGQRSELN